MCQGRGDKKNRGFGSHRICQPINFQETNRRSARSAAGEETMGRELKGRGGRGYFWKRNQVLVILGKERGGG